MRNKNNPTTASLRRGEAGFTLIETVIYIALFGIFIGSAVVAGYDLLQSNDANQTQAHMETEGQFLLGKIKWDLAQNIDPTAVVHDTSLNVTHLSLTPVTQNTITFTNISFTLETRTSEGRTISQVFSDVYFPDQ
jgi:type II secretory pathway pseudopilin PulG